MVKSLAEAPLFSKRPKGNDEEASEGGMPTSLTISPESLQVGNTTIFAVRHADVLAGTNPHLSAAGQGRANELIRVLGGNGVACIYASQFVRTQETAQPMASHLGLAITVIAAADSAAIIRDIRAHHLGESVLVVGAPLCGHGSDSDATQLVIAPIVGSDRIVRERRD